MDTERLRLKQELMRIPPGCLKCRVWTKLRVDTVFIESERRGIIKHKLTR